MFLFNIYRHSVFDEILCGCKTIPQTYRTICMSESLYMYLYRCTPVPVHVYNYLHP